MSFFTLSPPLYTRFVYSSLCAWCFLNGFTLDRWICTIKVVNIVLYLKSILLNECLNITLCYT